MTSKLSSNSLIKNLSISATASTTEILLKVSLSLVLLALSYSYQKAKRRPFPSALPFFCNISILFELPYLISQIGGPGEEGKKSKKKYKNIRHFFHCKRKELQSDIFFLSPLFASGRSGDGDVLCITTPEDQAILMKKEKYLEFCLPFPETALRIEGKNNLQSLRTGKAHSAYRKIFSSILSPRALNSFTPYILSSFQEMWEDLEKKSSLGEGEEQHIRLTIRETQLRLMCKILYGMTYETEEEEKQFQQFCEDFELAEKGLFPPGGVKTEAFKKGMEAKNRIAKVLYGRFDKIYQERLKLSHKKEKDQAVNVGNAMVIIADALIQDMKNDSSISYEVARENLYLLLEASHGTTMHITSAMMYFLNHPDYKEKLKKLREEVSSIKEKVSLNKDITKMRMSLSRMMI